jgi:hypothetical protein
VICQSERNFNRYLKITLVIFYRVLTTSSWTRETTRGHLSYCGGLEERHGKHEYFDTSDCAEHGLMKKFALRSDEIYVASTEIIKLCARWV